MSARKSKRKPSPKKPKHQPFGLTILFEDRDIIVVDKINGLLTVGTGKDEDRTAHFLLNNYVRKGNIRSKDRVYVVHRLDKDTSGILIFAKTAKAKEYLQENWSTFSKKYYTVINGRMDKKQGTITSYLLESKALKVYEVAENEDGKLSKTGYKTLLVNKKYSLLDIELFTGRKHQIRVHLANMQHPVLGDRVYGEPTKGAKRLALHSYSLTITHPFSKKPMTFETEAPDFFKSLVKEPRKKALPLEKPETEVESEDKKQSKGPSDNVRNEKRNRRQRNFKK